MCRKHLLFQTNICKYHTFPPHCGESRYFSPGCQVPKFCTKLPPLVKLPRCEKMGMLSDCVIIFYVNFNILSTALLPCGKPLWTTMWRMWKTISFQQLLGPFPICSPVVENRVISRLRRGPPENKRQITLPLQSRPNRDFFIE